MKFISHYDITEILSKLRKDEWVVFKADRVSLEGNNYSAEFIVDGNLLRVAVNDHNKDLVEQYEREIYKETAPKVLEELVEEISLAVKDLSCDHIKDNKGAPFSSEYNSVMITSLLGKLGLSCRKVSSLISDNLTYFTLEIFGEKFNTELSNGLLVIRDHEGKARVWGDVEDILAVKSLYGVDFINVGALSSNIMKELGRSENVDSVVLNASNVKLILVRVDDYLEVTVSKEGNSYSGDFSVKDNSSYSLAALIYNFSQL